jgi:CRISPR-associated exonuclease Cas4
MIPLSALNHYLFCQRRAALIHVEGIFEENMHTVLGELVHEHADLPGYELAKGVTLLRALPVWSERLGLSGKCDVVEVHPHPASGHPLPSGGRRVGAVADLTEGNEENEGPLAYDGRGVGAVADLTEGNEENEGPLAYDGRGTGVLVPVEYKKGKRRAFANDDAQLCAQALCLEEMFGQAIGRGAVFHAASKRRREVEFTPELRALVERSLEELRGLLDSQRVPPAVFKPACEECSLFEICLPRAAGEGSRAERLARQLFQI